MNYREETRMNLLRHSLIATALVGAQALLMSAPAAAADACKLEISGTDSMTYDKTELAVPATCKEVTLTLHHSGQLPAAAMGHDWVLVNTPDMAAVVNAGMGAGLTNNYIAAGDKRVIAHTKVVGGGQSDTITFSTAALKAGGDYTYMCTFPGHSALMHGKFKFG
jgi:azurin